ncbi:hypothetical protein [Nonomuraea sp. B19D2]|uniref:hypothetical protein n=1 Tax=Nonomuraea sp. B19D2 TaxID=3159561 RepID=UPI0032DAC7E5
MVTLIAPVSSPPAATARTAPAAFAHPGVLVSKAQLAETARIQGQDLYPEIADRLRHALGLHAKYQLGAAVPSWLCGGSLTLGLEDPSPAPVTPTGRRRPVPEN